VIISKTPYRVPLAGGGTDIDFYYRKRNGYFSSVAIDQYVYVLLHERGIEKNYLIQTTKTEFKKSIDKISHKLIRETLRFYKIREKLHVATFATVPTQTGLGSSSAMIVGLINCLNRLKKLNLTRNQIFKDAYLIERKICNAYGGWQDQIISEYGGLLNIKISKKENIKIDKISLTKKIKKTINNNFLLVYTNKKRESSKIILKQKQKANKIINYYDQIKSLNDQTLYYLKKNDPKKLGEIFNKHWTIKKKLSSNMTNKQIDNLYEILIKEFNFYGGKLIGAGGGGFFLMVGNNLNYKINKLKIRGFESLRFNIEKKGSLII
tara:strand:+ start:5862 stop:6827 length:966 start_codon:yes stop_codon:yes gene_type:complete